MSGAANWRDQIRALAKQEKRGLAGVAARIGISRPALSMLVDDKYPGNPARALAKVLVFLGEGQVSCPFLRREITDGECRTFRTRPQPTSAASELRHWVACRDCPLGAAVAGVRKPEANHAA